ncbi:hypothetical protein FDF06_12905 [Clostridium botulinum]|nr:hypothetical protein [Clostridium botulinum]
MKLAGIEIEKKMNIAKKDNLLVNSNINSKYIIKKSRKIKLGYYINEKIYAILMKAMRCTDGHTTCRRYNAFFYLSKIRRILWKNVCLAMEKKD